MTLEFAEYGAASVVAYRNAGGGVSHVKYYAGEGAQARTKVSGAVAAW